MRGTLHLVVAEDLPWMLRLTAPRVVAGAARRRAELGLTEAILERDRELAVQALAGGQQLRRAELLAVWDQAGLATTRQRGYHMLAHLAQTGTLCFGPVRDGEQLIVLVDAVDVEAGQLTPGEREPGAYVGGDQVGPPGKILHGRGAVAAEVAQRQLPQRLLALCLP